jgi:putative endonuclease
MSLATLIERFAGRSSAKPEHLQQGERGEKLAARFLRRKCRFKILLRNFKAKHGEIDIVCRDKDTLVFVEVKTRASEEFGTPAEAVDREKRFHLSKAALEYLRLLDNPDILFRFDIVEVVMDGDAPPEIRHIPNAFQLSEPFRY